MWFGRCDLNDKIFEFFVTLQGFTEMSGQTICNKDYPGFQ